jgi:hypothetical protein
MVRALTPLLVRSGTQAVFSGHEHNFQHAQADGVDYFVSGAAGKVRRGTPGQFAEARTLSWAAEPHFLLVQVEPERTLVTPVGENGAIQRLTPGGEVLIGPVEIKHRIAPSKG